MYFKCLFIYILEVSSIAPNVRRYVALAFRCIGTVARRAPYRLKWGRGVFALVVRCRVMTLFVYSHVGKNPVGLTSYRRAGRRDTRREPPAGAGMVCAASHRTVIFYQKILVEQKPMTYTDLLGVRALFNVVKEVFQFCFSHRINIMPTNTLNSTF